MQWAGHGSAAELGWFFEYYEMPWDTISESREKVIDREDLVGVAPRGQIRKIADWNDI